MSVPPVRRARGFRTPSGSPAPSGSPVTPASTLGVAEPRGSASPRVTPSPINTPGAPGSTVDSDGAPEDAPDIDFGEGVAHRAVMREINAAAAIFALNMSSFIKTSALTSTLSEDFHSWPVSQIYESTEAFEEWCFRAILEFNIPILRQELVDGQGQNYSRQVCPQFEDRLFD